MGVLVQCDSADKPVSSWFCPPIFSPTRKNRIASDSTDSTKSTSISSSSEEEEKMEVVVEKIVEVEMDVEREQLLNQHDYAIDIPEEDDTRWKEARAEAKKDWKEYKGIHRRKGRKTGADAETSMNVAAEKGDVYQLQHLLQQQPDYIGRVNQDGDTPLHLAVKGHHVQCCQVLLNQTQARPFINLRNRASQSPLSLSITTHTESTKMCKMLLSLGGAKMTNINKNKQTALHLAAECGNLDTIQLLLDRDNSLLKEKDKMKQTALHLATQNGHWLVLRKLIEAGANIEDQDSQGFTALHWAAKKGFTKCCKTLLELHADVNAVDNEGNTPLHLYCVNWREYLNCLLVLLHHQADINAQNKRGETPLHFCSRSPIEMVQTLKQKAGNINLNLKDKKGRTALHYAAERRNPKYVEQILSINTITKEIINSEDNEGKTPLQIAIIKNAHDSCHLLLRAVDSANQSCGDVGTILHLAAKHGLVEVGEHILNKGAKITKNSEGQTPLHLAAANGYSQFCQMLKKRGTIMSDTDAKGRNVLHYASDLKQKEDDDKIQKDKEESHADCCRTLVEILPNLVNKVDNTNRTPLHLAVEARSLRCCEALLTTKTNVWVSSGGVCSAVKLAYDKDYQDIFRLLLLHYKREKGYQSDPDVDFPQLLKEALENKKREVAAAILDSKYWEMSLKQHDHPDNTVKKKNTNLKQLVEVYPDLAMTVFDKCCSTTTDQHSKEDTNNSPVYYLDPPFKRLGVKALGRDPAWSRDHPLLCAITHRHYDILAHPLVTHWCHYKWNNHIWLLHYTRLMISICMAIYLTLFTTLSWDWTYLNDYKMLNQSLVCPVGKRMVSPEVESFLREQGRPASILGYIIDAQTFAAMLFFIYKIMKIRLQCLQTDDMISIFLWVLSLLFVINFTHCSRITYIREDWQWVPGGLALLVAWIKVILVVSEQNWYNPFIFRFHQIFRGLFKMCIPLLAVALVMCVVYGVINKPREGYNYVWRGMFSHQGLSLTVIIGIFMVMCLGMVNTEKLWDTKRLYEHKRRAVCVAQILVYDQLFPWLQRRFNVKTITEERQEEDTEYHYGCVCLPCRRPNMKKYHIITDKEDEKLRLRTGIDQQNMNLEKMIQELRTYQEDLKQERKEFRMEMKRIRAQLLKE
ncbi:hypothetical protein Pcinc_039063 [Petrolisthes cinctipes]|uniref:Transient receptor potential cation channel subfamily A member 1 n=1 Tax=Petrolisthes cinctipes TaxID=88211 RepID=A0AAE1BQK6_PETCI|nr:hypothetical protein Pcinc_039063 [Petrolisthes cinctipes]